MNCAPEKVFMKNNPVISPIDMSTCIISRTAAMIECVVESLNSNGYQSEFSPDRASKILWQVECNLAELKTIVNLWYEAERQRKGKVANILLSLHLDTTGLIEDLEQEPEEVPHD
jgi:hypothetical protein